MTFKKEKPSNFYLGETSVENIFINEFMPDAPDDFIKVYLYAYMAASLEAFITNEDIAEKMDMDIEDVRKAWNYWEKKGLVRKYIKDTENSTEYDIGFINLKDTIFGKNRKTTKARKSSILDDKEVAKLFREIERISGRTLKPADIEKIGQLISEEHFPPELISFAFNYCKDRGRSTTVQYACALLVSWRDSGIKTLEGAKNYLEKADARYRQYRTIMKELGLHNQTPTESEKSILDSWMDEMGFSLEHILDAAAKSAGINGNKLKYVNAILRNQYDEKHSGEDSNRDDTMTASARDRFYDGRKKTNEKAAETRRAEIFNKFPRVKEIEDEIRNYLLESGKVLVSGASNKKEAVARLNKRIEDLEKQKADILAEANYEPDYMDIKYDCIRCKDTGILDNGASCDCYEKTLADM